MKKTWWKESVVYQIYPRSFYDSNGDGIGDLGGITEKMDYLKELGIDVIWLSPVYESPNDDNGYDISNYQGIMKEFGTMEDFDRMLDAAHTHGIRIVMDLVVNHTSDEHPWFIESRKSKNNPYRNYYIWKDPKDGDVPNNWGSCFGGSAWKYDETTQMYFLHMFSQKQPDLNWENDTVRSEVFQMMDWWCQKGIDGFRMDVISMISKDQNFPDGQLKETGYGDYGPYVCNGPRVHEYLQEMNQKVLSKYDLLTVGECAGVTVDEAKKYANLEGSELNMVFQFEHVLLDQQEGKEKWDLAPLPFGELKEVFDRWQTRLYGRGWNSLFWNNHDLPRIVSRWGNDREYRVESAKMLATLLHGMQGTPYIYQGEELGMTNIKFPIEDYRDIETRNLYEERRKAGYEERSVMESIYAKSRDNARTPMQWDDSENAGFTHKTPWIRMNPNYPEINAAAQVGVAGSVFEYYRKLIHLRKSYMVFVEGRFQMLLKEDENIFAYMREDEESQLLVVCNFFDKQVPCKLLEEWEEETLLIGNYEGSVKGQLRPYEARMYLKRK